MAEIKTSFKGDQTSTKEKEELSQKIVDIARVTRVTEGGRQIAFRVCVVVGDKKGKVGMGISKGSDVAFAISKALTKAKKNMIQIPLIEKRTIPYEIREKFKAVEILLKPAPSGSGIIAGGAMRTILNLGGVKDVVGKILGSKNKINNVKATFNALKKLDLEKVKRKK